MFGRRRRTAPVVVAPVTPAPPELSNAQVYEHLHGALAELVGANGAWTLVPRQADDTDVIFHGLKVDQIAAALTEILSAETVRLRTVEVIAPRNVSEPRTDTPANGITSVDTGALLVSSGAEPTALPWNPAPISVWADQHDGSGQKAGAAKRLVA